MLKKLSQISIIIVFILLIGLAGGCAKKTASADLVVMNGKIVTMDEAFPQAEALAVRGNRIIAIGTTIKIKKYIGPSTEILDLNGKLAVPGLIDSHLHFTAIGQAKISLDLTKAKSWDAIVALVAQAAKKAKPGEWITGRGWHQEKWAEKPEPNVNGLPGHEALSQASPENPVLLTHASGHSSLANAKAMALAKITAKTPNPPGGEIIRDAKGNPIGAFLETAQGLLREVMARALDARAPAEKETERLKVVELADRECLSKGLTSVHDAGEGWDTIQLFKKAIDQGKLGVRLNVMLGTDNKQFKEKASEYRLIGYGGDRLTVRSIKRFADGALGSRGAWLLEPYEDLSTSTGLNTDSLEDLRETAKIAIENGFQLCVHAIGDRANREILNIYEEAFKAHPNKKDVRWRVEHAQHLSLADIPRFGRLGIIAAMQAIHCTSDGPWVLKRLGAKRAEEGAYVWRRLMASGTVISNGTDAPVEDVDPVPNFYASVTRKMKDGQTFYPDQKMTREETLRSYTLNGAYAAFEENIKGSLVRGKLADITVFSKDIMTCPDDEILSAQVVFTIVGGKVLYRK